MVPTIYIPKSSLNLNKEIIGSNYRWLAWSSHCYDSFSGADADIRAVRLRVLMKSMVPTHIYISKSSLNFNKERIGSNYRWLSWSSLCYDSFSCADADITPGRQASGSDETYRWRNWCGNSDESDPNCMLLYL